jgi:hypothetical protein
MNNEFYNKLVDLYAGRELPSELQVEMEARASQDARLAHDMLTLRTTVDALHSSMDDMEFTEESYQRILMKVYARGVELQETTSTPAHLQYYLPIQG